MLLISSRQSFGADAVSLPEKLPAISGSLTVMRIPEVAVDSITRKLLRSVPAALPKSTSSREPSGVAWTALKSNEIDWLWNAAPVPVSPAAALSAGEYGPPKSPELGSLDIRNMLL